MTLCFHSLARGLAACLLALAVSALPTIAAAEKTKAPSAYRVYIGTYTRGDSEGIYQFKLNLADGSLQPLGLAGKTTNPSFLAIHPDGKHLYAVGETAEWNGMKTGGVTSFAIDTATGKLKTLNTKSSGGTGPCHITTDAAGKAALVANYGGGSVAALTIAGNGRLNDPSSFIQHEGSSVDPRRQKGPHAHSINLSPDGRFAFAADLGLDKVLIYKFDAAAGKLTPNDPAYVKTKPGGGPRHFAFHTSGKYAFVNLEMTSEVTALSYDAARGELNPLDTLSTLPKDFEGNNSTAEVQVHPSGKFVYVSNRGHNSIACFKFDENSGKLSANGHAGEGINIPRNFTIEPSGQFMIVANQNGNDLVVFRINQATGKLHPTGHGAEVPSPVCVRYLPWD